MEAGVCGLIKMLTVDLSPNSLGNCIDNELEMLLVMSPRNWFGASGQNAVTCRKGDKSISGLHNKLLKPLAQGPVDLKSYWPEKKLLARKNYWPKF